MPDTHPIDTRFREQASAIGVDPPAHLRANVLAAVRSRRRRAIGWRAARLSLLGLLLLGGAFAVLRRTHAVSHRAVGSQRTQDLATAVHAITAMPVTGRGPVELAATLAPSKAGAVPPADRMSRTTPGPVASAHIKRTQNTEVQTMDKPGTESMSAAAFSEASVVVSREALSRLVALGSSPVVPVSAMRRSGSPEYYKPRGSWWLASAITAQAVEYRWTGSRNRLVDALSRADRAVTGVAWGLFGGRQWPSGFRLGLGADISRAQQSFRMIERESVVVSETVTNVVTLNTLVVFSTTDTLTRTIVQEDDLRGQDQRTSLSIPFELSWVKPVGRWRAGPRIGLAFSKTWISSSSSLIQSPSGNRISTAQLSSDELGQRYPMAVSALAGLEIGFVPKERWVVYASPFYGRGLVTLGGAEAAHALPDRFGLRLLISYSL